MSLLRTIPSVAAACGLAFCAAAAAFAQDAPSSPAAPHAPGQRMAQGRAMMREHMEHRRAEHLKLLHDALSIRADQEGAWQAFAVSMTPQPGAHEHKWAEKGQQGEPHALTTPERLDRMAARMAERQAAFQHHAEAVKAFYAALSPAQQHTFDALAKLNAMHGGPGGERPMIRRAVFMGPAPQGGPGGE